MKTSCLIAGTVLGLAGLALSTFAAEPAPEETPCDIVAALPVIPDARFNLANFGGVGDGRTFNTEAFHRAITAIAQAGGGHLLCHVVLPYSNWEWAVPCQSESGLSLKTGLQDAFWRLRGVTPQVR